MRNTLILAFLCPFQFIYSQNIVKNPGFEVITSCPDSEFGLNNCPGWEMSLNNPMIGFFPSVSPLMGRCATDTNYGIPQNRWGNNEPDCDISGCDTYAMITTGSTLIPDVRNFLIGTLDFPLLSGQKYYVRFRLNVGESSRILTNNVGIKFYVLPPDSISPFDPSDGPEVENSSIIDADVAHKWIDINGNFIAMSRFNFFAIGNFKDDANTAWEPVGSGIGECNYFIDNVCISEDSTNCPLALGHDEVYVEPLKVATLSNNVFRILNKKPQSELTITDIHGRVIMKTKEETISLFDYPPGIYIFRINSLFRKVMVF